ncbi:MAG: thermonuclease family protein [Novosphingobium meiothermophilum]
MPILAAAVLCVSPVVHDGDTLHCGQERVRIANIDAPELPGSPKCDSRRGKPGWCDYDKARESRDALIAFLGKGRVMIKRQGKDRYGRTLARVTVNGRDAGAWLVSIGLARPWR